MRLTFFRVLLHKTDQLLVCEGLIAGAAGTLAFPATDFPSQVERGSGFPGILNMRTIGSPMGILLLLGPLMVADTRKPLTCP